MRVPSVESGEAKSLVRPFITEFRMASEKVYNFQPFEVQQDYLREYPINKLT